ncbi:Tyrosine sulfotransferase [Fasciola gigantica]|uniref:Protein-tyrosine sulfotransferase n=1 Tax=Fasciola gigantica TaxID=46835 RepID=A0A504YQ96_FASGI|nr:Tyrosine sulfotransferase [Fasciola gigantica]
MRFLNEGNRIRIRQLFLVCCAVCFGYTILQIQRSPCHVVPTDSQKVRHQSLVFIGGHPRSGTDYIPNHPGFSKQTRHLGTTLLRVLLDVHPHIRCGPETHLIPRMLNELRALQSGFTQQRLVEAHIYPGVIQSAFRAFIRVLIEQAGPPAPVLCSKDPLAFEQLELLGEIFPSAKFVHMVRDGRAVTDSMIRRRIRMTPNKSTAEEVFHRWELITNSILDQCLKLTLKRCLTVPYEKLVLQPESTMRHILRFLDVPWDFVVLRHEQYVKRMTILSRLEPSTKQVHYPIHLAALTRWAGPWSVLPTEFACNIHKNSSLLQILGYAKSTTIPPNYGPAEPELKQRTLKLFKDPKFRRMLH